jgi:hypothetical protein
MNKMPLDFNGYKERNKWIKDNATEFSVVRRRNRRYERYSAPSFDEATALAQKYLQNDKENSRWMIYAIVGIHDTLVATCSKEGLKLHE